MLHNSGENIKIQQKCEEENLGVRFETTAPGTPQQNCVVEMKFPTIMGRDRAMINHICLDENYRSVNIIMV